MVLNADDLGMSDAVNAAIFSGIDAGWVTSVSVLARGPVFADAARRLVGAPVSVGVHLDATEFFRRGSEPAAIRAEWSAQLQRVLDTGLPVSHLDSHQHLHYRAPFRELLLDLARENGIARVRRMGVPPGWWRVRAQARAWLHNRHLPVTTDAFYSLSSFIAADCPRHETIEIMLHPGNPHHADYPREVDRLQSGWLATLAAPLVLIRWSDV